MDKTQSHFEWLRRRARVARPSLPFSLTGGLFERTRLRFRLPDLFAGLSPGSFVHCWSRSPLKWAAALVIAGSSGAIAQAATLNDWRYSPESGALAFQLEEGLKPRYFLMANPMRIVVDLPDTQLAATDVQEFGSSAVQRIRLAEFQPGTTRFVLELAPGTVLQSQQVALTALGGGRWEVKPLVASVAARPAVVTDPPVLAPPLGSSFEQPAIAAPQPLSQSEGLTQTAEPGMAAMLQPSAAIPSPAQARVHDPAQWMGRLPGPRVSASRGPRVVAQPSSALAAPSAIALPVEVEAMPTVPFLVEFGQPVPPMDLSGDSLGL